MIGGLTFMAARHMCCGVNRDELIVRLHPGDAEDALDRLGARPMDFTRRPMRGFITVRPRGLNGQALKRRVPLALAHAEALPPKREKDATR